MNLFEFEGKRPVVHPEAFVAATATLIGDVTVEAGASIWYGAVLRGDICTIVVRAGSNIQDNSVLHAAPGERLADLPFIDAAAEGLDHALVAQRQHGVIAAAHEFLDAGVGCFL